MKKLAIFVAILLTLCVPADAFIKHGKAPVSACSASLDFSQACNSQYIR